MLASRPFALWILGRFKMRFLLRKFGFYGGTICTLAIGPNAQIWSVPLGFQISGMFLCCVSLSDNSGEACGLSFVMRRSSTPLTRHLQIATQTARLGVGQSIRLFCQTGSDHNSAHGSIRALHLVQTQSRSSCPV